MGAKVCVYERVGVCTVSYNKCFCEIYSYRELTCRDFSSELHMLYGINAA